MWVGNAGREQIDAVFRAERRARADEELEKVRDERQRLTAWVAKQLHGLSSAITQTAQELARTAPGLIVFVDDADGYVSLFLLDSLGHVRIVLDARGLLILPRAAVHRANLARLAVHFEVCHARGAMNERGYRTRKPK